MKNRYGKTYQGLQIKNMFKGKDGRLYAVVERKNDYAVGFGYDKKSKSWAQGYYDFPTREKAVYFAKERAYRKY